MRFYITTSIPYVNGPPHLGHAMEFVIADVLARQSRIQGNDTLFATGSDEHGGKIAEKAQSLNLSPKEFTNQMTEQFVELLKALNISNDRFIRTTDPEHERIAQEIWLALKDNIYKGSYRGWYCTGDEAFFPEAVVKANNGICPAHNRPYEKIEEENYFFKLSQYNQQIKKAIESDELKIIPETRKNEILQVINDGLEDISISRPKEKISWGVNVPGDDTQTMYVWFEALLNYITVLGYPESSDFKQFWPAQYQIIGKDIIRFHAAIWPGILFALNLPLPKVLYVHGFINVDGQKMSKSLGNSVEPKDIIEKYGTDAFRYFFLKHIPSYNDGDFSWQTFTESYNNELANDLGNLVQRNSAMIQRYLKGSIGALPQLDYDNSDYLQAIEDCKLDEALDKTWEHIRHLNQTIDEQKPWVVAKTEDQEKLRQILAYQCASLIEIANLLKPFLPEASDKITQIFTASNITPSDTTLFPKFDLEQ